MSVCHMCRKSFIGGGFCSECLNPKCSRCGRPSGLGGVCTECLTKKSCSRCGKIFETDAPKSRVCGECQASRVEKLNREIVLALSLSEETMSEA